MLSKYRGASVDHRTKGVHEGDSVEKGKKAVMKHESFKARIEEEGRHLDFMSLLREADDASVDHPFFFFVSFEYDIKDVQDGDIASSLRDNQQAIKDEHSSSFLNHVDNRYSLELTPPHMC
jgi:hypothetical protein